MALIERLVLPEILDALTVARVVAIVGARQVGKSTLARQIAERDMRASVVTLDDAATRAAAAADPTGFIASLSRPVMIDEVQRVPDLLLAIKAVVDVENRPGQFLLTGSADLRTLPTIADALPGRVEYVELWPLSESELAGTRETIHDDLEHGQPPFFERPTVGFGDLPIRIARGGFPAILDRTERQRARFFRSYLTAMLAREISETTTLRNPESIVPLLRLLGARTGDLVNHASLRPELALDDKTIRTYIAALERLFLVIRLPAWRSNLGHRIVKAAKLHIADPGLAAHLIGADGSRIGHDPQLAGRLLETLVVCELGRQVGWARTQPTLYHYRDDHQREIDVVIEWPDGSVAGVEVKSSATVREKDFGTLRYVQQKLGSRFKCGIILYTGQQTLPFGPGLWAVPVDALWSERPRPVPPIVVTRGAVVRRHR